MCGCYGLLQKLRLSCVLLAGCFFRGSSPYRSRGIAYNTVLYHSLHDSASPSVLLRSYFVRVTCGYGTVQYPRHYLEAHKNRREPIVFNVTKASEGRTEFYLGDFGIFGFRHVEECCCYQFCRNSLQQQRNMESP